MNDLLLRDKQVRIDGSYYKIGVHNRVYIWTGERWITSTRERSEVVAAIKDRMIHGRG